MMVLVAQTAARPRQQRTTNLLVVVVVVVVTAAAAVMPRARASLVLSTRAESPSQPAAAPRSRAPKHPPPPRLGCAASTPSVSIP
jgi:hypothetical protein